MRMATEYQNNESACNLPHEETGEREKCFQINPGMKSRDQRKPLKKKKQWRGIQKLWTFAVYTAWVRLGDARTHVCAHRNGTHAPKETQHGALSYLNLFYLMETPRLLSVVTFIFLGWLLPLGHQPCFSRCWEGGDGSFALLPVGSYITECLPVEH